MSLTFRLLDFLSRRSRSTIWLMTLASVLILGGIDYLTGSHFSITFFYLLPVSLASWSLGKTPGRLVAVLSAVVMQAGLFTEESGTNAALPFWNLAVRLGIFLVVANLVAEFRRLLSHQTELSRTDALTGSMNRRAFLDVGETAIAKMQKQPSPLTLAFLDVDNFKEVNDASGHAAGDALLVCVAECLKSQLWGSDTVARLGGDEFGLILPDTDPVAAQRVMPRLRERLLHEMKEADWPVTFSVGVVTCLAAPPDIERIIHLADQLMYAAKRGGKDRIEYALYPEAPAGAPVQPDACSETADERILEPH